MTDIIVDLSSNNAHPIDYAAAKAAGVIAAFVKATDGIGYVNPFYAIDVAGFAAVGVPVLGYHFAEFGSAEAEAAKFVSVAGARARVLDVETNSDVVWQNDFLAALNLPADEELDYGSASTLPRTGIRALLWPASYGKDFGFGDCWQFTDAQNVPGIGTCDASVWVGPQADFDALFSIAPSPTPPTPEADMAGISPPILLAGKKLITDPMESLAPGGGQEHRCSIFLLSLEHWYAAFGSAHWDSENVAAKAAAAAGQPPDSPLATLQFDPTQVPDFRVYGGQIVITALELNTLSPITFRQNIGESTWGCDQFIGS